MYINWARRELHLKIVYYGPAMSGKTTNLCQIYDHVDPSRRSDLISLKTAEDRTMYFDFMQLDLGRLAGLTPRLQFYTVPGQARYEISRKLVLRAADGVVFVGDSQVERLQDNFDSWVNMRQHLASHDLLRPEFPIVLQWNKRDLASSISPNLFARVVNLNGRTPILESIAIDSKGVLETLQTIIRAVVQQVQTEMNPLRSEVKI